MKEQEFLSKLGLNYDTLFIKIGIFYALDKNGNVLLNEEDMKSVFDVELNKVKEVLK